MSSLTILHSIAGETTYFELGPIERDDPPLAIVSSLGTSPVEVTTVTAHGAAIGDKVRVEGHLVNAAANGEWIVAGVPSATKVTLSGAAGSQDGGATGTLTRVAPIDLTLANTEMRFTAKRKLTEADAEAFLSKSYGIIGGPGGITVNDPATVGKNLATVTVADTDTNAQLSSTDLDYDVQLKEPSGRVTLIARGVWKLGAAVTRA